MDMDCSFTLLGQHLGANRSPLRSLDAIAALVDAIQRASMCTERVHTPPTDARARAHLPRRRVDRALCVLAHVQLVGVMGYEVRAAPRLRNALASSYFARARPGGGGRF